MIPAKYCIVIQIESEQLAFDSFRMPSLQVLMIPFRFLRIILDYFTHRFITEDEVGEFSCAERTPTPLGQKTTWPEDDSAAG